MRNVNQSMTVFNSIPSSTQQLLLLVHLGPVAPQTTTTTTAAEKGEGEGGGGGRRDEFVQERGATGGCPPAKAPPSSLNLTTIATIVSSSTLAITTL